MNIFEIYKADPSSNLQTIAGYPVTIARINPTSPYPLEGWALCSNNFKYELSWDVNGHPNTGTEIYGMELRT